MWPKCATWPRQVRTQNHDSQLSFLAPKFATFNAQSRTQLHVSQRWPRTQSDFENFFNLAWLFHRRDW